MPSDFINDEFWNAFDRKQLKEFSKDAAKKVYDILIQFDDYKGTNRKELEALALQEVTFLDKQTVTKLSEENAYMITFLSFLSGIPISQDNELQEKWSHCEEKYCYDGELRFLFLYSLEMMKKEGKL